MHTHTLPPSPPTILLVEDSDEDYTAFARAIKLTGLEHMLYRCRDGNEALDFLFRRGRYTNSLLAPHPSLIVLDLNLPDTDGHEVLAQVKQSPSLCVIPLIVLTTSANPRDVNQCYCQGANGYQVKSANYESFKSEVQRTMEYWLRTVVIPKFDE